VKPVKLYAPEAYWLITPEIREALEINGCGPKGWLNALVPDTIYGLKIAAACDIHDYMYIVGETQAHKEEADDVFRNNLIRIIMANTDNRLLRWLRLKRVKVYYEAVSNFGGPWFWADKNPSETMGEVTSLVYA
jgi:hypothetical protein